MDSLRANRHTVSLMNAAVTGQTTTQILAKLPADLKAHYLPGMNNIAVLQEGTNHLYSQGLAVSDRVERAEKEIQGVCLTLRNLGYRVIIISSIPRNNGYPPGSDSPSVYNADCIALDRLVESRYTRYADRFWDVRAACPEYNPGSPVYSGDTVHQTAHGHQLMGSRFALFLRAQALW